MPQPQARRGCLAATSSSRCTQWGCTCPVRIYPQRKLQTQVSATAHPVPRLGHVKSLVRKPATHGR